MRTTNARARNTDPHTSHAAATSVTHLRESQQTIIRIFGDAAIDHGVRGMTDEQLVAVYESHEYQPRQSPSGIRTRRRELADAGWIFDTGERQKLASGRKAIVWALALPKPGTLF